jgi:hypothetical protein
MGTKRMFGAGVIAGFLLVGAAGWAADILPWNKSTVAQANAMFEPKSGYSFVLEPPPDPDTQLLQVNATTFKPLDQSVLVQLPGSRTVPPDPCFTAAIGPAGDVTMTVADEFGFEIEDRKREPLHFCAAN